MIARLLIACLCCLLWAGDGSCWEVVASGGAENLGPELLVNGTFDADSTTGWAATSATISASSGVLTITSTNWGSAVGSLSSTPLTNGLNYKVTITIISASGTCSTKLGGSTAVAYSYPGTYSAYISSFANVNDGVRVTPNTQYGNCVIDNISVKRVL